MKQSSLLLLNVFFLVFWGLFALPLFSQNIRNLSVDDGLPQSSVSGIVEGEKGFIWIGTRNGLARYDGDRFTIFQTDFKNPSNLSSNLIYNIKKSTDNTILIQYDDLSIDRFDLNSEKAAVILPTDFFLKNTLFTFRDKWLLTAKNTIWLTSSVGGLYNVNVNDSEFTLKEVPFPSGLGKSYNILEDKNNVIWVLCQNGLAFYDKKKQKLNPVLFPKDINLVVNKNKRYPFYQRKNGELLWTDENAVYFYNPNLKKIHSKLLPSKSDVSTIRMTSFGEKEYLVLKNSIYSFEDQSGFFKLADISIGTNTISGFLVDQSGLLWLGTDRSGIYTVDRLTHFNSFYYKEDFAVDLIKEIYGLAVVDFFKWKEDSSIDVELIAPAYYFRSLWQDKKHWIASNRTVCYYDSDKQTITSLPLIPRLGNVGFNPITGLSILGNNPVIIDGENMLFAFEPHSNKWRYLFSLRQLEKKHKRKFRISNLYIDDDQTAWLTTESDGLIKTSLRTKESILITDKTSGLPTNCLISIVPDKHDKNSIWIGSTSGLVKFDKKNYYCTVFSVEQGFPDNEIYSILPNGDNLWLGTNKGLVAFDTRDYKVKVFKRSHGLKNIEFNRHHQFLFADGKMAFGGIDAGVTFYPKDLKEDTFSPNTVITNIKIYNDNLKTIHPNLPPTHSISSLKLPYFENTISFHYSALQFNQPDDIKYRYRLLGYDEKWIITGDKKEAVFTKLPPGNYTFEVVATNTSGKWSNLVRSIEIEITPPWWKTTAALFLYLLIGISAIVAGIKFKVNTEIRKKTIALKLSKAEELRKLDKVKTRFFSNIAHELRTPLALILGPAELLRDHNNPEKNALVGVIEKNAASMLNLTDQLLDMAKLEAGVLKPSYVWGDVIPVIANLVEVFLDEAKSKQVKVIFNAPDKVETQFSVNTLNRIVYNLLSNALKFTFPDGTITVSVLQDHKGLTLQVEDTGIGIPEEELKKIFKRYYSGGGEMNHQGSGIGLSLVQEFVDLHKGTITVHSTTEKPSGTTISIWLPVIENDPEVNTLVLPLTTDLEKPTILVVDDHIELTTFIAESLKNWFNVRTAFSGDEALEFIHKNVIDLVLSDVSMQPMDGFELCRRIKQDININHIPVIVLTAKADMESRLEGLAFGANDYVTKPFSVAELHLRINNLLELQKQLRLKFQKNITQQPEEELDNSGTGADFLAKMHHVIDQNLDDPNFSVEQLSGLLFMSRSSLHRKTKFLFDLSTGEIIKTYRIKKSTDFLKKGFPVSEVAHMTGFNTASYFIKCFKEVYKITPTQYASNLKN